MKRLTPQRLIFLAFAGTILLGTLALYFESHRSGRVLDWTDAAFTATSATCVTGLVVKSTAGDFSFGGQMIILVLIQVGGFGILTFSSWFLLLLGRRPSVSQQLHLTQSLSLGPHLRWYQLVGRAVVYTLTIEAIGAALLFARFLQQFEAPRALYFAVFHSVSAFCNAGFDLFGNSLVDYTNDVFVNIVFMALIILGGIGFYVLEELRLAAIAKKNGKRWSWSLHARAVLITTGILIVFGAVSFFGLELFNRHLPAAWYERILPALFQSVTARTAGFNTVEMSELTNGTLSVIILLMIIGASPGSTGGGIKTTTLAILAAMVLSRIRGRPDTEIRNRRVPADLVGKALAVTLVFLGAILVFTLLLQITELGARPHSAVRGEFLELGFESASALGTVGLSLGVTPNLSTAGRWLIVVAMFAGRLGPLSFALSLIGERRSAPYRYPEERLLIG